MQDQIKEAVESQDVEDIHSALREYDVTCSTRQNGKILDVPGYGSIFWDDQPGVDEPGYVVREHHVTGADEPVDSDELVDDLVDLVEMVD